MKFFYGSFFEIWLYFQKQIRKGKNTVMFSLTSRDEKNVTSYVAGGSVFPKRLSTENILQPTRSLYDIWLKSYDSNSCFYGFWWPWPWPLAVIYKKKM